MGCFRRWERVRSWSSARETLPKTSMETSRPGRTTSIRSFWPCKVKWCELHGTNPWIARFGPIGFVLVWCTLLIPMFVWTRIWNDVDVNKLLFLVLSLHFFVRKRLIENDRPRLGFSEQLVNRNYLHLLTRLADLSLRTFLGRDWPFGLHFCGCNGGNTHMQSFLTPFRKLATIAILLAYS